MANEIEIVVSSQNKARLDQYGRDAKSAGRDIGQGLEKGFRDAEQAGERARRKIGADLDKTAQDAKEAGGKAGTQFGTQFGDNVQSAVSGGAADVVGGLLDNLKGAGGAAAAGAGIGLLILDGISASFETGNLGGLLAAKLNDVGGQAARFGRLAGDVYADNFGGSLEEASSGIQAIIQNKLLDSSAVDSAIRSLTEKLLTVAAVVGEDANMIARAARQMLVNGLAKSADEAFDIIVRASQRGLNVNGDLIDTVVEYSTKFRDLGLTGQQSMGLISQAMDAGARDTDFAADALKEFAIRAQDGSDATIRGFQTIGLNAEQMGMAIAAGGDRARVALGQTLNALRQVEDPVMRNQAAVDLFGTKAEDLGRSLFAMDLDRVASDFGDVAGATDQAAASIETAGQRMEGFWRKAKNIAAEAGTAALDFLDITKRGGPFGMASGMAEREQARVMGEYKRHQQEAADAAKQRAREAATAWMDEKDQIAKTTVTLETYIQKQKDAMGVQLGLAESEIRYQQALDDAAESLQKNGKTLDINTDKGRQNKEGLLEIADAAYRQIEAMEQQGATSEDVRRFLGSAREEFIRMASQMGMNSGQAQQLADKLRLIPGNYTATVGVVDAGASNTINSIRGNLINLTNRQWVASVAVTGGGRVGGGRYFPGLEHGGISGGGFDHAAEGGARGGRWTMIGEHGRELAKLAPGTQVFSNPDTERMLDNAFQGGGGPGGGEWTMRFAGNLDSAFASAFMKLYNNGLIRIGRTR